MVSPSKAEGKVNIHKLNSLSFIQSKTIELIRQYTGYNYVMYVSLT